MEADWWPRCCRNSRKRQTPQSKYYYSLTTSSRSDGDPCSLSAPLVAASGALVLLDVLCLRRRDADTGTMVPPLANVTANPKVSIVRIPPSTCTAQVSLILVASIFLDDMFLLLWRRLLCLLAVRIGFLGGQGLKGKYTIRN